MFHNNVYSMVLKSATNFWLVDEFKKRSDSTTWLGCESVDWPSESLMSKLITDSAAASCQLGWLSGSTWIGFLSILEVWERTTRRDRCWASMDSTIRERSVQFQHKGSDSDLTPMLCHMQHKYYSKNSRVLCNKGYHHCHFLLLLVRTIELLIN